MGYAHGTKWNEEKIEKEIKNVMNCLGIERMPSKSEIESVSKNSSLSNKISKSGGFRYWANKLNLEIKDSETKTGNDFEIITGIMIEENCKLSSFKTTIKHPFDLLSGKFVKIDVKCSRKYTSGKYPYFTFNLGKNPSTCDIYVCHCINDNDEIEKTFVIPACELRITQLSVGNKSMYDKYIDAWWHINEFDNFYRSIGRENE